MKLLKHLILQLLGNDYPDAPHEAISFYCDLVPSIPVGFETVLDLMRPPSLCKSANFAEYWVGSSGLS